MLEPEIKGGIGRSFWARKVIVHRLLIVDMERRTLLMVGLNAMRWTGSKALHGETNSPPN